MPRGRSRRSAKGMIVKQEDDHTVHFGEYGFRFAGGKLERVLLMNE